MIDIQKTKEEAIENIITRIALNGALQRNQLYASSTTSSQKKEFRNFLSKELKATIENILLKQHYSDDDHYHTIFTFSERISKNNKFRSCLDQNRLKIGTTQKLINLGWKMSWLLKPNVKMPIHCPFDSIVIAQLPKTFHHIRWTKINSIEQYSELVQTSRAMAQDSSIAEWELHIYNSIVKYEA